MSLQFIVPPISPAMSASAHSRSITESGGMMTCLLRSRSMTARTNTIA
jgi:hypothetical protein